ncbi:helix-turn-helix domain-containing protein [Mycobacterium kansasii]|uniref:helix-turn-helix domain-containing protein n=1 Tax=Mycobacterium kansasii TaxID=1768 RepID=UPI003A859795
MDTELPDVATPEQVAKYVHKSEQALAQDRYLRRGLPYVKYGKRIRYLRQDVLDYLAANRVETDDQQLTVEAGLA